jgi:hypothetical protein
MAMAATSTAANRNPKESSAMLQKWASSNQSSTLIKTEAVDNEYGHWLTGIKNYPNAEGAALNECWSRNALACLASS